MSGKFEKVSFPSVDGKKIYGTLRTCAGKQAEGRLIFHIHGIPGDDRDLLSTTTGEFFTEKGYDHFAIALWDNKPDARRFGSSSFEQQVGDVGAALKVFQKTYDNIFIIGHSYGGLIALILNPAVRAMSFWDPSLDTRGFWDRCKCILEMKDSSKVLLDYNPPLLMDRRLLDEISQYGHGQCLKLAEKISTPTQFVIPEQSLLAVTGADPEEYRARFRGAFDLVFCPSEPFSEKTGHRFSEPEARFKACKNARRFFESACPV